MKKIMKLSLLVTAMFSTAAMATDPAPAPTVSLDSKTEIGSSSLNLVFDVNDPKHTTDVLQTNFVFLYDSSNYPVDFAVVPGTGNDLSTTFTNLKPNAKYHVDVQVMYDVDGDGKNDCPDDVYQLSKDFVATPTQAQAQAPSVSLENTEIGVTSASTIFTLTDDDNTTSLFGVVNAMLLDKSGNVIQVQNFETADTTPHSLVFSNLTENTDYSVQFVAPYDLDGDNTIDSMDPIAEYSFKTTSSSSVTKPEVQVSNTEVTAVSASTDFTVFDPAGLAQPYNQTVVTIYDLSDKSYVGLYVTGSQGTQHLDVQNLKPNTSYMAVFNVMYDLDGDGAVDSMDRPTAINRFRTEQKEEHSN